MIERPEIQIFINLGPQKDEIILDKCKKALFVQNQN